MLWTLDEYRAQWTEAGRINHLPCPTLASSSPGITHLEGTTLRLTALLCAVGSQSYQEGSRSSAPSMAPCNAYLFLVHADAG